MSGYTTIVVGTDGSDSSLRAVEKAGQIAAGWGPKVVVATAYFPQTEDQRAADVLKDEGYKMSGNAPIYAILRCEAGARGSGRREVGRRRRSSAPRRCAGRSGPGSERGPFRRRQCRIVHHRRSLLGSVPANVARRSKTDVLIVHTTP